jgi:hypothetical protein
MLELAHTSNIVIHVIGGTLGLVLGFLQLAARKGTGGHTARGRVFLACVTVVVVTAAVGLSVFRFVAFLGIVTLLLAYWAYSGYRALRIRDSGPGVRDALAAGAGLTAAGAFIAFLQRAAFPWAPEIIYSTLGTLTLVCAYDLVRLAFPRRWYARLWLPEHIVKMLGAHGALAAAFSGTVLDAWQPFSQIAPSVLWTAAMVGFAIYYARGPRPAPGACITEVSIRCPPFAR